MTKLKTKQFDLSYIEDNPYNLLLSGDDQDKISEVKEGELSGDDLPLKLKRRVDTASKVTKQITAILECAAGEIVALERHRLGIGDTETDESITDEFYTILHY